jgi:3-hydroxyisobutyrate dehydrogenase-like beta-hydroxyacid dehydrogenase
MAGTQNHGLEVAVLGTGIMGSAMARNLVAAGLRTTVWDRSSPATAALSQEWALKDMDLAIDIAGGEPPPLLAALSRQWRTAVGAGLGRDDVSAARLTLGGHQNG